MINLFLHVVGRRHDGYHDLASLFQVISLHDVIHFVLSDQNEMTCTDPSIPTDSSNLVIKAANLFRQKTGLEFGLRVHLEKNIPYQDLNGTIWEVELISVSEDGSQKPIKDKIKFDGKSFVSYYFSSQGFLPTNYSVTVQQNGFITWETVQRNPKGETVSWRGDWQGNRMEGALSYRPAGMTPQDFSFMSNNSVGFKNG